MPWITSVLVKGRAAMKNLQAVDLTTSKNVVKRSNAGVMAVRAQSLAGIIK